MTFRVNRNHLRAAMRNNHLALYMRLWHTYARMVDERMHERGICHRAVCSVCHDRGYYSD